MQIWCHPTSNPWAAPLTLNNETSLSPQRQHQWWFYWHMERSHSCEPCGQKLQLIWIKYVIKPTFEGGDAAISALAASKIEMLSDATSGCIYLFKLPKIKRVNRTKSQRNNSKRGPHRPPWGHVTPFSRCVTAWQMCSMALMSHFGSVEVDKCIWAPLNPILE